MKLNIYLIINFGEISYIGNKSIQKIRIKMYFEIGHHGLENS